MNVIIFDGLMGSGKTLGMCLISAYYAVRSGCAVYSNFGAADAKDFLSYRDFLDVVKQPSSIVRLDEAHTLIDSRNHMSKATQNFTTLCYYLRKMRTTLMLTSPQMESIDVRVRDLANIYVKCSKNKQFFIYQLFDGQTGRLLKTLRIGIEKAKYIASQMYDTHAMVTPIKLPEKGEQFEPFLLELKEETERYYLSLAREDAVWRPEAPSLLTTPQTEMEVSV